MSRPGPSPSRVTTRRCCRLPLPRSAPTRWRVFCRSLMAMRIANVIGTVTLSRVHPSLTSARWVIGVPYSLRALRGGEPADGEDLVIYDNLGAGKGHQIGFSEGGE